MTAQTFKDLIDNLRKPYQIGNNYVQGCLAIHVYATSVSVVDMTNAGKRGKTCATISVCSYNIDVGAFCDKLADVDNLTKAILWAQDCKDTYNADVYNNTKRGVDVIPLNLTKFSFRNDFVVFNCLPNDYDCSDLTDGNNQPKFIDCNDGVRAKKAFYNFCVKNQHLFTDKTKMWDIHAMAVQCGCMPHSYCAMD